MRENYESPEFFLRFFYATRVTRYNLPQHTSLLKFSNCSQVDAGFGGPACAIRRAGPLRGLYGFMEGSSSFVPWYPNCHRCWSSAGSMPASNADVDLVFNPHWPLSSTLTPQRKWPCFQDNQGAFWRGWRLTRTCPMTRNNYFPEHR